MAKIHINLSVLVKAEWDDEAGVWVATSDDVPGLVAEHSDYRQLQQNVIDLIPILLIENGVIEAAHEAQQVPVHIAASAVTNRRALVAA